MTQRSVVSIIGVVALGACLALGPQAGLAAQPGSPATSGLTLAQALQEALTRNPQVTAAQQAVAAAQQGIVVAQAGFAPTVSADGTGTYGSATGGTFASGSSSAPGNLSGTGSVSLTANLPLYDGGRTRAAVETARAALSSAEAALRQTTQDTALSVATAFFSVLQAEQLTTVQEALLAQAQAQLALSQAQVRAGVAAQSDVIQVQAQVAQAQVNLLQARSQIATSKAGLQGAIGMDAATPVEVQPPPPPPLAVTVSADAVMTSAEANRPEVAKAQAAVASNQAALDLAHVSAGPQVDVGVGATYTPFSTSPVLNNSTSYGVTATVSLPLYDAGKGKAEIAGAEATLLSAQAQLTAARLSVRQDAYQSYLAAVQDSAAVTATQVARDAADEALRVAEGRYRTGVGTIVEVITARATAAQADVNAVTAQYTYQTALATLQHAVGMPIQGSTLGGSQ
ncbi:MAG TPA: TolC family protein [bacterium]|nr:TolC family protein [bacterium]